MTNLEYINSLPCSQRLKDRIIEIMNAELKKDNINIFDNKRGDRKGIDNIFDWSNTTEKHFYWYKINQSIINNTPIVE